MAVCFFLNFSKLFKLIFSILLLSYKIKLVMVTKKYNSIFNDTNDIVNFTIGSVYIIINKL